jgi:hypothetical protein
MSRVDVQCLIQVLRLLGELLARPKVEIVGRAWIGAATDRTPECVCSRSECAPAIGASHERQ